MKKGNSNIARKERLSFIRSNMPFYLTGLLLIFIMKYYYSRAGAAQLLWLLAPTAGWVSILSGIPFEYVPDAGYANHGMKILIAPSCSGMQFMLITAAMLIFSFVHLSGSLFRRSANAESSTPACSSPFPAYACKDRTPECSSADKLPSPPQSRKRTESLEMVKGFAWICFSLIFSYLFTIFVNGLRIIAAIYLPPFFERLQLFGGFLTPNSLHTLIGTTVYFAALLNLCRLTGSLFFKTREISLLRRCLPPVFWYFFIVLGIPFLNRAYAKNGEQFAAFAVLITLCCGGILLLYFAGALLRKRHGAQRR